MSKQKLKMNVKPTPGRALVRVEMPEFSTTMIISGRVPEGETGYRMYIDELADNDQKADQLKLKVGDEILLEDNSIGNGANKLVITGNSRGFTELTETVKQLSREELIKFKKDNPILLVIEYMIVNLVDIRAIVTRS